MNSCPFNSYTHLQLLKGVWQMENNRAVYQTGEQAPSETNIEDQLLDNCIGLLKNKHTHTHTHFPIITATRAV